MARLALESSPIPCAANECAVGRAHATRSASVISSATSNLTPWLDIALCGGFAQRKAQDVHDEIHAKALVLDNGETRIGIVVCDFVCMPRRIADAVKTRVAQNCGISPSNLLICATHTHSGPAIRTALGVNEDPDYVDWVPVKIADAVQLAVNRLQPARIGWGTSTEDRISFNPPLVDA